MSTPNYPSTLDPAINDAERIMGQPRNRIFSPEGFERLNQRIAEYISELTVESVRVARRYQADSVSPAYVDRAAEHIASGRAAKMRKILEGLGTIILGIGLATAGTMVQTNAYNTRGVVLSVICIVLGMPAFLFHFIKD